MDVRKGGCVFSPIWQSLGPFLKYVPPKLEGQGLVGLTGLTWPGSSPSPA